MNLMLLKDAKEHRPKKKKKYLAYLNTLKKRFIKELWAVKIKELNDANKVLKRKWRYDYTGDGLREEKMKNNLKITMIYFREEKKCFPYFQIYLSIF